MSEFWKNELKIAVARKRELIAILEATHRREAGERAMLRRAIQRVDSEAKQISARVES